MPSRNARLARLERAAPVKETTPYQPPMPENAWWAELVDLLRQSEHLEPILDTLGIPVTVGAEAFLVALELEHGTAV